MKQEKQDRRSQKTRQALGDALVELMLHKNYHEITVQEIIDRANVGRSTFYAHYIDKDDLLFSEIEQVGKQMHLSSQREHILLPITELFEHVRENQRLFKALTLGSGADFLFRAIHHHLNPFLEDHLRSKLGSSTSPVLLNMVAYHITGSLLTMLNWWLNHKMPLSPEEMDVYFHQLVVPGVEKTFNISLT